MVQLLECALALLALPLQFGLERDIGSGNADYCGHTNTKGSECTRHDGVLWGCGYGMCSVGWQCYAVTTESGSPIDDSAKVSSKCISVPSFNVEGVQNSTVRRSSDGREGGEA